MRGLGPRRLPAFSIGLALDALPDDAQRNLALRWRPNWPGLRLGVVRLGLVDLTRRRMVVGVLRRFALPLGRWLPAVTPKFGNPVLKFRVGNSVSMLGRELRCLILVFFASVDGQRVPLLRRKCEGGVDAGAIVPVADVDLLAPIDERHRLIGARARRAENNEFRRLCAGA